MASIFDQARKTLKDLQGKATNVAAGIQAAYNAPAPNIHSTTPNFSPFQQAFNALPKPIQTGVKQSVQYVANQPLLQMPGYTPNIAGLNQLKLPSPSIGQYIGGQFVKPFQQLTQSNTKVQNKIFPALQLGFNATPAGNAYNIAGGVVSGTLRSIRTGQNLNKSISKAMASPSDIAGTGLGIKNPIIASGVDLLAGNPKAILKKGNAIKNVLKSNIYRAPNRGDARFLDEAASILQTKGAPIGAVIKARRDIEQLLHDYIKERLPKKEFESLKTASTNKQISVLQDFFRNAEDNFQIPKMGLVGDSKGKVANAGSQYSKNKGLSPNLKVSDAYSKNYLGYNINGLEKQAIEQGYDLFGEMIKRVDSQTTLEGKIAGMESILQDLVNKPKVANAGLYDTVPGLDKLGRNVTSETRSVSKLFNMSEYSPTEVNKYVQRIKAGEKIPPVIIEPNGEIIDGVHRVGAYRKLGIKDIPVLVAQKGKGTGKILNVAQPNAGLSNITPNTKLSGELYNIINNEYRSLQDGLGIDKDLMKDLPANLTLREAIGELDKSGINYVGGEASAEVAQLLKNKGYRYTSSIAQQQPLSADINKRVGQQAEQIAGKSAIGPNPIVNSSSKLPIQGNKSLPNQVSKVGLSSDGIISQPLKMNNSQDEIVRGTEGLLDHKSSLLAEQPTIESQLKQPKTQQQESGGGGQSDIPNGSSSDGIISDPVNKVIEALKMAKPIRGEQEALYSAERAKRVARIAAMGNKVPGEKGYFAQLGQLKGELPKVQFEGIRKQIGQPDIDSLFNKVEQANISPFEKVTAKGGLAKLLGAEGGTVPNRSELELLNQIFPAEFVQAVLAKRSLMQKALSIGNEALNLPRAIMSTLDLSAPLRQGVFLIGRPKQFAPAFKDMFKYAFSEKAYQGLQDDIKARPTYQLMRQSKLAITDMSPLLGSREEAFMSNLVDNIPGFGIFAKGSNRAYSGFLNKLRADTFDDLVRSAKTQGIKVEGKTLDDIAKFVNSATGRGDIGGLSRMAPILNGVFFSPRLIASRLNLLNPQYYASLDPFVRKEALKSLLTFGATAGTVLGLAKLGGAEVGADPRSSDFGKIKVGNTRYDILGGFQQYIKLAAQLVSGQVVSSTTGKVITLGEGYKPLTRKDIILRFGESKTAPVFSFITDMLTGQTGTGEPFQLSNEVISRVIPLMAQDIFELAQDKDNIGQALAMAVPGMLGVGSQTYGKSEMVTGKNQIGETTSQIRPTQGLAETITEKVLGKQPLGNSSAYNVETYYDQMLKMPREDAAKKFDEIIKTNPDLAKKIIQVVKNRKMGVTVEDQVIKAKGVSSGDRAVAVADEFNKLSTREEKAKLWEHYVKIGVINKNVAQQLVPLLRK